MSLIKRPAAVPVALLCLLASTGCTGSAGTAEDAQGAGSTSAGPSGSAGAISVELNEQARALLPEETRASGVLVVASDPTYPPFEFMAADNETLTGFDIELSDMVAQALGVTAEHRAATFDTILPGLTSGKYDVGASAFSITDERQKAVDFVPYLAGGTGLAVPAGNPEDLSLEPGGLCGHSVAAQKGSIQALEQVPAISKDCVDAGEKPVDVQTFPGQSDANLALMSGRADGVLADSVSLAPQAEESGGKFEMVPGEDYEPSPLGLAVEKDSELTPALAEAMKGILDSDAYDELYAKWQIPDQVKITVDEFAEASE